MIVADYSKRHILEMDFISLDVIPKMETEVIATPSTLPFYRTIVFKASVLISFISILCFPQPEWLMTLLHHPIGAIILASLVSLVLIPELDWWVVVLSVIVVYILLAITGLIETNLDNRRKRIEQKKEQEQKKVEKKEQMDLQENTNPQFESQMMHQIEPMALNAF